MVSLTKTPDTVSLVKAPKINRKAIGAATAAVETYTQRLDGVTLDQYGTDTALVDLLADLMHLADRHELSFDHLVERAAVHYFAEVA